MGASVSSLFGWISVPSANIPRKPDVGEFLNVRLLETTGLPDKGPLYCRREAFRLWEALSKWSDPQDDSRSIVGIVRGPPGTGKSTTTFAWLQWYVELTGKSVCWFHVTAETMVYRVDFTRIVGVVYYKKAEKEDFDTLGDRIKQCSSDVLVLDGYRDIPAFENEGIRSKVRIWAGKKKGKRTVVIVSSYAFTVRVEEKVDAETRVKEFQKFSWTRDEYIAAFKRARPDSDFGMQVSKRRRVQYTSSDDDDAAVTAEASNHTALTEGLLEDIDEKFYYAGGCARYFFGFSIEDVKLSIKEAVDALSRTDIREVLQRGSNHPETRHRLVSFFKEDDGSVCKRIVSQFAVQKLVEQHGEDAFPFLYSMGSDNPSFEGWVFEADFFFQYERARVKQQKFMLNGDVLNGEDNVELNAEPIITFDHDDMVHKEEEKEEEEKEEEEGDVRVMVAGIDSLSYRQLQQQCLEAGLSAGGDTNALRKRLRAHKEDGNSQKKSETKASKRLKKLRDNLRSGESKMWKPKIWNQGGYDGFYVFTDPKNKNSVIIWFFQVTRDASHELKLKFFVEIVKLFLDAGLEVSDCQIYFVIPAGNKPRVSGVTPYGKLFYEKFGWVNGQEKEKIHGVTLMKTTSIIS